MKRRFGFIAFVCAMVLLLSVSAFALADSVSQPGEFIRATDNGIYLALSEDEKDVLYSMPAEGGNLVVLETGDSISSIVNKDNDIYYLRREGEIYQIVYRADGEESVVFAELAEGEVASNLCLYDDLLYCVINNQMYSVDPESGDVLAVGTEKMTEFVIVEDVVFFASESDTRTYDRVVTTTNETLNVTGGALYSMSMLGDNAELVLDVGVSDIKVYGSKLYFHNLQDNYPMGDTDDMWLEGKLYRYDINEGEAASMELDYDWSYFPTPNGVVVYTSADVSLYPLDGGTATKLFAPELRAGVTAYDSAAYVYEYTDRRLTLVPLTGDETIMLYEDGDVVNAETGETLDPYDIVLDEDDIAELEDDTDADESEEEEEEEEETKTTTTTTTSTSSSKAKNNYYIFPNSSKKKLTEKQILKVDRSKWAYGRNEIYARHGYSFKTAKYRKYFRNQKWYKEGGFSTKKLNSIEWYNMNLIKKMEKKYS